MQTGCSSGKRAQQEPGKSGPTLSAKSAERVGHPAGAHINAHGWFGETALFSLEENAVRGLIRRHANLEARNDFGETPLIETVSGSIADILINAGADVNARDNEGKTALIRAGESNYVDKLEVLVKAPGIRLELRDNDGETALMRAKAKNLPASVAVLAAAGATQ